MILPLGYNCMTCNMLNKYGIREKAYPLDWVVIEDMRKIPVLLKNVFHSDEKQYETFINDFFDKDKNSVYKQNYDGKEVFVNKEYDISFPHIDNSEILDVMVKRFYDMRRDYHKSKYINVFFYTRWEVYNDVMENIYELLKSNDKQVHMYIINGYNDKKNINNFNVFYEIYDIDERKKIEKHDTDWIYEKHKWEEKVFNRFKDVLYCYYNNMIKNLLNTKYKKE